MSVSTINTLRLVGGSGTNKVMAGELSRLCRRALPGFRLPTPTKAGTGTLIYPFDAKVARVAVNYHRTCSRVLWDLVETRAARLEPLYDEILAALKREKREWLWDGATISVRARNVASFAAGERQVVGTVKNAIVDAAAARGLKIGVRSERPDLLIAVRIHDDVLTVSIDLAGRGMHQRGYRKQGGPAPLRENMAAVLVMLSRWDARSEILLDPMAGSGTIAIEAALMSRAEPIWTPPHRPTLERLPALRQPGAESPAALFADTRPRILANELHTPTVAAARENIAAAGVGQDVVMAHGDFVDLSRRRLERLLNVEGDLPPGVILCNPPYGERVGGDEAEVEALYRKLGSWCRSLGLTGWRAAFLCANPAFPTAFGARPRVSKPLSNASLRATFTMFDLE